MTPTTATLADGPETLLPMAPPATQGAAFTFGDPVPVLDGRDILDYLECWTNGRWYEPPVDPSGLAKTFRASTHHASALYFKRNLLASRFVPHRWLNRETFSAWALDYLVFGNAYLERPRNLLGGAMQLRHALAKYVRRGGDALERYWFVQSTQEHEFTPGSLHHLREHDITRRSTACPSTWPRCSRPGSTSRPRCSGGATTTTAATRASSCMSATRNRTSRTWTTSARR